MPKRNDIRKILVIGSGPIVIGQAAEFDYAGTQACLALKEEGYEVVLCNSNPATIMTDTSIADKVYMEPLTLEYIAKILRYERPDAILPGIGGQTGLNLAMQLEKKGILDECRVELLGTKSEAIEKAEDRELFKELCESIGEPVIPSEITYSVDEAKAAAKRIGYPVVLRPAFTLGGTGGGFADTEEELLDLAPNAFALSPVHEVLIEKSVKGYKESTTWMKRLAFSRVFFSTSRLRSRCRWSRSMMCRTRRASTSGMKGFLIKSIAPKLSPLASKDSSSFAVRNITGISDISELSARSLAMVSKPSISDILTSRRIKSGILLFTKVKSSFPELSRDTFILFLVSILSAIFKFNGSSSTTAIQRVSLLSPFSCSGSIPSTS